MTNLKTDTALLEAIRVAAKREPSAEELQKQRVSFIMGSLSNTSTVTRSQVAEQLAAQEGRKLAAQ